jgi:hypothetical protein
MRRKEVDIWRRRTRGQERSAQLSQSSYTKEEPIIRVSGLNFARLGRFLGVLVVADGCVGFTAKSSGGATGTSEQNLPLSVLSPIH